MKHAIRVGLFFTVSLAVLAYLIMRVEDLRWFGGETRHVDALFSTVVGLDDKAPVRVAGVRVGSVDGITLEGRRARVRLRLDVPVALTQGTAARVANAGILGDKYVELVPGPDNQPALATDATIPGTTPVSFDDALAQIGDLASSLGSVTGDLADQNLGATLGNLLTNLEAASEDLRTILRLNRDAVSATVGNVERASATLADELPRLAEQIRSLLGEVEGVVAENRGTVREGLASARALTDKVQVTVDHLNTITEQIASGEGTIGKLIHDDEGHDSLVTALDSVSDVADNLTNTLGRVDRIDLQLGLEGTYFTEIEESRTVVRLDIEPDPSRYYLVELVDDPRGQRKQTTDVVTTTLPDGTIETTTIERITTDDDFTFSAQFGFRFRRFDLRAGLFESTGGAAIDWHLLDRRLRFSLEAFDFSRDDRDPRVRLRGRYALGRHLYLVAGYDDVLNAETDTLFLGAGVRWRDDDLKYLLGSVPRF